MTNGVKVYVCGLESDPISEVENELNELGKERGGSAIGYISSSQTSSSQTLSFDLPLLKPSRFSCDLTSKEGIEAVSQTLRSKGETHLDILISNAGIRRDPPIPCNPLTASLSELQTSLWSSRYEDWTTSFQINSMAHYFSTLR